MLPPYFPAADAMLYKLQRLGRAGKAGPGRTELPSAASTHAEGLAGPNVTYSTAPASLRPPEHLPGWRAALRFHTARVEAAASPRGRFRFAYFLTCNDSSSFTSSFGGNKSLAWIYSKLGGPSSPCIANKTDIQTVFFVKRQKSRLLDTLGTPIPWGSPGPVHGNASGPYPLHCRTPAVPPAVAEHPPLSGRLKWVSESRPFQLRGIWKAKQIHLDHA